MEAWNNMKQLLHVLSFYDNVVTLFILFCSLFIHTNNTEEKEAESNEERKFNATYSNF